MTYNDFALLIVSMTFVVLTVFLARLLFVLTATLQKANATLETLEKQIQLLNQTPKEILLNAQHISSDFYHKMQCLNPIFHSLSNLGEGIENTTETLRNKFQTSSKRKHKEENEENNQEETSSLDDDRLAPFIDFALAGMRLWKNIKR